MLRHIKGIFFLIFLSLVTALIISQLYQRAIIRNQAAAETMIEDLKVQRLDAQTVLVNFYTPTSTLAYIEYKDLDLNQTYPLFQGNRSETDLMHSFVIRNVGLKGGEATIIVDGKRFLFNNQPLRILADQ